MKEIVLAVSKDPQLLIQHGLDKALQGQSVLTIYKRMKYSLI